MSTLTATKEPASVWLTNNPDEFEFSIRVLNGNPLIVWNILLQFCRLNYVNGEIKDFSFVIQKSFAKDVCKLTVNYLKHNDIEVIIPPMEMSA